MAIQKKAARPQKTKAKARTTRKTYLLQEAEIDVEIKGMGLPLLLLHSEDRYERGSGFVEELAKKHRLIMPWMPGFGNSTLPESVTSIEDISYLYLDLLDQMFIALPEEYLLIFRSPRIIYRIFNGLLRALRRESALQRLVKRLFFGDEA